MSQPTFTLDEVKARIAELPEETAKSIVCAMVGHSRIVENCCWMKHCARCKEVVGDALGGSYNGIDKVQVGHNCDKCRENYAKLDWRDTFMAPNPFTDEPAKPAEPPSTPIDTSDLPDRCIICNGEMEPFEERVDADPDVGIKESGWDVGTRCTNPECRGHGPSHFESDEYRREQERENAFEHKRGN